MNEKILKMELHKVSREIKIHGTQYNVSRTVKDKYGEDVQGEYEQIATIDGLFHISKGYITNNISDGTRTHSKGSPMLLVLYEQSKEIQNGDFLMINENKYKVIEKNNIQEYNIIVDISLELVLDGRN